ncbi:MAG: hypothetical protein FWF11_01565 [Coriobacteriia bacterium]|nr:hypothetical protein [Coriobacteriia bacterium]
MTAKMHSTKTPALFGLLGNRKLVLAAVALLLFVSPLFVALNSSATQSLIARVQEPLNRGHEFLSLEDGLASLEESGITIVEVSAGYSHSMAICADGKLYTWGNGYGGRLGLGDIEGRSTPQEVTQGARSWKAVAAGDMHSLALDSDGYVWAWGENWAGQLGVGDSEDHDLPQQVILPGLLAARAISAGYDHSFALDENGNLWAWGDNIITYDWSGGKHLYGRLGLGDDDVDFYDLPQQIPTGTTRWAAISAGGAHALALDTAGNLWAWGRNNHGQLGLDDTAAYSTPQQVTTDATVWQQVSAGANHSLAIDAEGNLWSWGEGTFGKLGLGGTTNQHAPQQLVLDTDSSDDSDDALQWQSVAAGNFHSLALDSEGNLWSWGRGSYGKLGLGSTTDFQTPQQVPTADDFVWQTISAGSWHSMARGSDHSVWTWGYNGLGALGKGVVDTDRGTGTDNWVPWNVAASLLPSSEGDWTASEGSTTPKSEATGVTHLNAENIVIYFDRPMCTEAMSRGTIAIDNGAQVNIARGVWLESPQGPNTVFVAPLSLAASYTQHTATVSGFMAEAFGMRDVSEMYPYSWTFTTAEVVPTEWDGYATLPDLTLDIAITKTLRAPEGTPIPSIDFEFDLDPVSFIAAGDEDEQNTDDVGQNLEDASIALMPQLNNSGISITADSEMTFDHQTGIEEITSLSAGLLDGVNFPAVGIYIYRIAKSSETIEPSTDGLLPMLTPCESEYHLNIRVKETLTGEFFVDALSVQELQDGSPSGAISTSPDALRFDNTLVALHEDLDPTEPAVQQGLSIIQTTIGSVANMGRSFSYDVTVWAPEMPEPVVDGYLAYVIDRESNEVVTSESNGSAAGYDNYGQFLLFKHGVTQTVSLTNDQMLVFVGTHIGARYQATLHPVVNYWPQAVITIDGQTEPTIAPLNMADNYTLTTGEQMLGEFENLVEFTTTNLTNTDAGLVTGNFTSAIVVVMLAGLAVLTQMNRRNRQDDEFKLLKSSIA